MLVLFETPAGYALFKVLDEGKLKKPDNLYKHFSSAKKAQKILTLHDFHKFDNTTEALSASTALLESKVETNLENFLREKMGAMKKEKLAVADSKLGSAIKEQLSIKCVHNSKIDELMRCIRAQMDSLITGLNSKDMSAMALGLSHSLSRYKLKFSPDKVDTMIVQAIALLDDLDKELNMYAMRVKEWYGWHFPEMTKIVGDNITYAKVVKHMGLRANASNTDFSELLPEEVEKDLKEAAILSMGTEVTDDDVNHIKRLCHQVIEIHEYREQLHEYLLNRMRAIAPNLSIVTGELVGARLISHAGSLMNLCKYPSSTIQILGAEKALFRALKTKHETPKYGLIYHASLVGQATPKNKGKISRAVAAKAALAVRVDALGEDVTDAVGIEGRAKVEARLRQLEGHSFISAPQKKAKKYVSPNTMEQSHTISTYNTSSDSTIAKGKKRKAENVEEVEVKKEKTKKAKKDKKKKKKKSKKK